jgi:hypothetical protein
MSDVAKGVRLRRAISLGIAALIVVALIFAVGFGLYFSLVLNVNNNVNPGGTGIFSTQTTTKSSYSSTYPSSANTTNSTLGLELALSTNNTSIESGQAMNVSLSVINALSIENNVSSASDWKISQLENHTDTGLQCIGWANFLVYRGYYTESNLSAGAISIVPLTQPGVGYNCTFYEFSLYSFQPSSSEAATYGGGGPTNMSYSYGTRQLAVGSVVSGYYTADQSYYSLNAFVLPAPFPTAVYTIVAGDQWGQLVILHFIVEPNPMTTTTSTSSTHFGPTTTISSASISYPCTTTFQNGLNPPINLKLELKQNTSLQVCIIYYYYNDSATDTLNFSNWQQLIEISSWFGNHAIDSSSNFTVTASIDSATLGGPNNVGEGTSVVYTITPKVYGNLTYGFSFGLLYPSEEACGQDFLLSMGNGTSYPISGCTSPLSYHYPVNSQGFVNGFLFAEIIGVSNSTQ